MDKKSLLLKYWELAANTEGWYPPYAEALRDVSVTLANWRPEGKRVNTIWETVAHVTYFKERLLARIHGKPDKPISSNDDTFVVTGSGAAEWQAAVARLLTVHEALLVVLRDTRTDDLDQLKPEEPLIKQFMDLIAHDAYHSGQIILLRKLYGAWPERRSFL